MTQITATLPTLDFPLEVDYPTQEDWPAFSAAAELNFGILGGDWSTQMQNWKIEANAMSIELNNNADIAQSIANYQGDWVSQGYTLGQSVSVSGVYYICKLTHITGQNPTTSGSLYWNISLGNWNLKIDKVTSTDNAIPRFDGITGAVQNSGVTIDDTNQIILSSTNMSANWADNSLGFHSVGGTALRGKAGSLFDLSLYNAGGTSAILTHTSAGVVSINNGKLNIDSSGNLSIQGTTNSSDYEQARFNKLNGTPNVIIYGLDGAAGTSVWTGLSVGKHIASSRSINATGTINASGADYAEYEYSNDINLIKGQIVGFKEDGTLTDRYNESVRFAIKSTNPSIVGGDTWGIEAIVGKRPEQPVRKLDKTEQVQIDDSEEFETVVIEAGDTDIEWETIEAQYKIDLVDFESRLEAERQKVDRIAYAGKVPVNVYGATAGQYIIAIEKDGVIDGLAVNKADMTFMQYQDAVGRVNKILDDGRAEVAVIIH